MVLDLTHLKILLSLPCTIDETKDLRNIPLLITATKINDGIYFLNINPNESISKFLKRIHNHNGPYIMDCTIYAQLVSFVLTNMWPTNGGIIPIFICEDIGTLMLWINKTPEMGYIGVINDKIRANISSMMTHSKGQWCIRISKNKFLGLSSDGPYILSLEEWIIKLRNGLKKHMRDKSISYRDKNLLNLYIRSGKLSNWGFFIKSSQPFIKARYNHNNIIIYSNPNKIYRRNDKVPRCSSKPNYCKRKNFYI